MLHTSDELGVKLFDEHAEINHWPLLKNPGSHAESLHRFPTTSGKYVRDTSSLCQGERYTVVLPRALNHTVANREVVDSINFRSQQ